ncbi:MAG: glycosyltransferase family 2 protein [Prevotellaceae bacterium]|jgi:GT2 family glycosyltransferase|nr:glycosyltransferase family 2 protein [Prevotellaceae bacterium]
MTTCKVAIVLLNWNGKDLLEKFLPSVVRYSNHKNYKVIVADNGSTDSSLAFLSASYPAVQQIVLDKNYGYTGGYNRALKQVGAEYYVLLNTDVEVTPEWLTPVLSYMDSHPDTAVCMPKIRSYKEQHKFEYAGAAGGFIDKYGYPFCRGRILNNVEDDKNQYNDACEIFWASGACMVVRSSVFWQTGGFDESFFAHMEEIDLCWRIKQLGYEIVCIPHSIIYHLGGGTLSYDNPRKLYYNHRNNLYMLYKNLPQKRFKRRIFSRLLLDGLSGIVYLLSLKLKAFRALLKAHKDYRKHKPQLKRQRQQLQQTAVTDNVRGIFLYSIVWKFYSKGKRLKFSDLNLDKKN